MNENKEIVQWESSDDMSFFVSERFEVVTDKFMNGLFRFLIIVGIPYTIYVVLQFFFSL